MFDFLEAKEDLLLPFWNFWPNYKTQEQYFKDKTSIEVHWS